MLLRGLVLAVEASVMVRVANALACAAFDASYNLYAFGYGVDDYNLGPQSNWASK